MGPIEAVKLLRQEWIHLKDDESEQIAKLIERFIAQEFEGSAANEALKARVAELEANAGVPAECPECYQYELTMRLSHRLRCSVCGWNQKGPHNSDDDAWRALKTESEETAKGGTG